MHYVSVAASWLSTNWATVAGVLAALMSLAGSLKALFSTHPKVEGALDRTLDVLSWVSRAGAKGVPYLGRFSVPLLPSRPVLAAPPALKVVP
jgi:hypothetical protein